MGFDRDSGERTHQRCERFDVAGGYRSTVEEIAGVIELDTIWKRPLQGRKHLLKLPGKSTGRCRAVNCPLPQVTERACKWAFRSSEKNRQCLLDYSARPPLLFDNRPVRAKGIDVWFTRTLP